jgi:hypothetical protein
MIRIGPDADKQLAWANSITFMSKIVPVHVMNQDDFSELSLEIRAQLSNELRKAQYRVSRGLKAIPFTPPAGCWNE